MRATCLSLVCLLLSWSLSPAEDTPQPDPREKLETAIPEGIRLLEAQEYATFIKTFAHPDDLKKITEKKTIEQLAEGFAQSKADQLLKVLKSIKDKQPTYSEDGNTATYALDPELNSRERIIFVKVDKRWYVKN